MKAYKKRFRRIFRNLTVRWILVSCITILPINVLTAVIAKISSDSYEEKLTESYNTQLSIYAERIDAEFTHMQNRVMDFLDSANLAILTKGSTTDSTVEVSRFKEKIGSSKTWISFPGLWYFWDHEKDITSFFHQGKTYSMEEMQQLEACLRQREKAERIYSNNELIQSDGTAFIVNHYNFQFFSFGLMYDVEWILSDFYDNCGEITGSIYLADENGCLLSCFSGNGFENILLEENIEQRKGSSDSVVLEQAIDSGNYRIVQVIERSDIMSTLPALINVLYILTGISFVALPILCIFASRLILRPLLKLCDAMGEIEKGNLKYHLTVQTGTIQMDYLYSHFNHMVDELHSLVIASYEKEIEKLQIESINMRLLVNQHMLLNFLNTIYSLSQVGKLEQISEFTQLLMKYFRYVLRQNADLVPVKEEMEFVKDYMQIQKIRFPASFTGVYSISESAEDIPIPRLLIENFVENTIKYGLIMGREIEILVNIRIDRDKLLISICDTGNGMPEDILEKLRNGEIIENRTGKHIGIWNCRRRLKYYYGDAYQMKITSKVKEGTQIWIEVPMVPLDSDDGAWKVHQLERREGQNEYSDR